MRPTQAIRKIMRKYGKKMLYTNKYKTCRTVKCYHNNMNEVAELLMRGEIEKALTEMGVTGFTVEKTSCYTFRGWTRSLIVRIPL